jgi:hypothetical protein
VKSAAYITTSWDDGHPLDFRVAELLTKYSLRGTFYVPRTFERGSMTDAQVRQLSDTFEIGGHTLHHKDLTAAADSEARQEITGCRSWIEDQTGKPCRMFCPPLGRYTSPHVSMIRQAGFVGMRSVELLSLRLPRYQAGVLVLPTTVHAYPHRLKAYGKNMLKRLAVRNLWLFLAHGRSTSWVKLVRSFVQHVIHCGGVLHLWGHSWELEDTGEWAHLEEVLHYLGQFRDRLVPVSNGELCQVVEPALPVPPGELAPFPTSREVP